jgi:hypothetical protein
MNVMRSLLRIKGSGNLLFIILQLVFLTVYGCGGGGGSTSSGNTGGTTTGGTSSQATLDRTNAVAIAKGAYTGLITGSSLGGFGDVQQTERDQPTYLLLIQAMEEAIRQINVREPQDNVHPEHIVTQSFNINGSCGGNASYTIQVNDATGQFSGNMTYNNYCSGGVTINGSTTYSGINNGSSGIRAFTFTFTNLTMTIGSSSSTLNGSITYTYISTGFTATVDLQQRDNVTGKLFRIDNWNLSVTKTSSYLQYSVSGRFYHSDYGYVEISTPTPFLIYTGQIWPSQGVMIVTGSNGTKCRLTVTSSTTYVVDVDEDGNGTYEWSSGTLTWR